MMRFLPLTLQLYLEGRYSTALDTYYVRARILDDTGTVLANFTLDNVPLLLAKDLRVMVSRLWSGRIVGHPHVIALSHNRMDVKQD
jgi:hypothetical protein